ncbi:MAG: hypothetical protein AAF329_05705 [Cyanobacteria bacterium P01_A01_bin.17]
MKNGSQSSTSTSTYSQSNTADERVNYLLSDYDRVTKSLESAKRQLRLHRLSYAASIVIILLDSWFSFDVLNNFGDSPQMALGLTLLIAATQWQVNTAIFNRRIGRFISPDRNADGRVTGSEWARWGFIVTIIASVYLLNVGTNMIGVDGRGLGSIVFSVPGVPEWAWLANATALFFATLLCFGDELINVVADDNKASLKRRIPDLQNQQAVLDARVREAVAFREQLMQNAAEQGTRRGANYRI